MLHLILAEWRRESSLTMRHQNVAISFLSRTTSLTLSSNSGTQIDSMKILSKQIGFVTRFLNEASQEIEINES